MTTTKHKKPDSIIVLGRRWFRRSDGNTYNSAQIYVDGKLAATLPKAYGYDNHYLQRAFEWLDENGYTNRKVAPNGSSDAPWHYCQENGIHLEYIAVDVEREKDL